MVPGSKLWTRRFDGGGEQDVVERRDIDDVRRFCRYGFDEIRVWTSGSNPPTVDRSWWRKRPDGVWAAEVTGSYRTGNNRSDMAIGPGATVTDRASAPGPSDLITTTTPCFDGNPVYAVDPLNCWS